MPHHKFILYNFRSVEFINRVCVCVWKHLYQMSCIQNQDHIFSINFSVPVRITDLNGELICGDFLLCMRWFEIVWLTYIHTFNWACINEKGFDCAYMCSPVAKWNDANFRAVFFASTFVKRAPSTRHRIYILWIIKWLVNWMKKFPAYILHCAIF